MQEPLPSKKYRAAQALQRTYLVTYCILVVAVEVAHITVAAIATVVLVVVAVDLFTTQVHILIDQVQVIEATVADNH
jgi:hypothetical protein